MKPKPSATAIEVVPSAIVEAHDKAEVDLQIATAKRYPRDMVRVKNEILELATADGETAADCWYMLPPRGDSETPIDGKSIRLAEIVAYAMGNLRYGGRIVDIDNRFVTAEGFCFDLEKNTAARNEVKRSIVTRDGNRYSNEMIQVTAQAAISLAIRNAIFRVVPTVVIRKEIEQIQEVAVKWLAERLDKLFAAFAEWGVSEADILRRLNCKNRAHMVKAQILQMRGYYTAIRDGETTVEAVFPGLKKTEAREPAQKGSPLKAGRHDLNPPKPAEPESTQETAAQKVEVKRHIRAANLEGHLPQAALKAAEAIWAEKDCETVEDFITVLGTNDEELLSINNVGEKTLAVLRSIFEVNIPEEPQDKTEEVNNGASPENNGTGFELERVDAVSEKNPRYIIRFKVNVVSGEQHRIAEDQRTGELRCDCPEFVATENCPHVERAKEVLG